MGLDNFLKVLGGLRDRGGGEGRGELYQRKLISGLRTACQNKEVLHNSADQGTFLS